ncbi:magnesium transporter spict [Dermatophagoides farinae]|uniref:Magnesium transporter NIPA3 n=1 Tax=Dermatophagoides farinae TaxID=6954 RepID=A0A922HX46_DERFA|nr:magnesium transporter NIPA2-like [Dermatophagoides farinae]KAH7637070.1 magnesium transporter nipa2-like protein [Dermatophagoides farinae]KAH9510844.1 Magnesium transporter NIPA3 [Dermatophagoides farinae]
MLTSFLIGVLLAIISCLFIGVSFILKKVGLIRLSNRGLRAGRGGYGYLTDWVWWMGLIFMGIGELANFTAYAFAPASLVTPLGALSVLVSSLLAHKYLKENLNIFSKIGCSLAIIGSTVIVLHAPKEGKVDTLDDISLMLARSAFLLYLSFVIISSIILVVLYAPRYGNSNVLVYILICSLIGSLSVISCKGFGIGLRQTFSGQNQLINPLFWVLLLSLFITVSIQMNYLNKALDIFDTSIVTPVYYVLFTSFVLIASAIMFREWTSMTIENIVGNLCGFATTIIGVFLLNAFKELNINMDNLKNQLLNNRLNSTSHMSEIVVNDPLLPDIRRSVQPGLITWTMDDDEC